VDDRVADIFEAAKRTPQNNSGPAGMDREKGFGLSESPVVQLKPQYLGQLRCARGRSLPDSENHQIKAGLFDFTGKIHTADNQIPAVRILLHRMNPSSFKMNTVNSFGLPAIAVKSLAIRSHVHVIYSCCQIFVNFFPGHQGFLDGNHAADRRTKTGVCL